MKLKRKRIVSILICSILGLIGLGYFIYSSFVTTVQFKQNLAGTHHAYLIRHNGIDVNFRIKIDGQNVYFSPDFAPVDLDFREQIAWDKTGNILILEVAGKCLFEFNAGEKRQLTSDELIFAEYSPFSLYRFKGKLPGEREQH